MQEKWRAKKFFAKKSGGEKISGKKEALKFVFAGILLSFFTKSRARKKHGTETAFFLFMSRLSSAEINVRLFWVKEKHRRTRKSVQMLFLFVCRG